MAARAQETFGAWSLMLLEGVRSLDEAVDDVREDRQEKEQDRHRRRDQAKLDRAQIKALNRQHRVWGRGARIGRQMDAQAIARAQGGAPPAVEPAATEPGQLPLRPRPSLQAVNGAAPRGASAQAVVGEPGTVDLTTEDDTQALPRLDSLEQKLKDLEQQFG